MCHIISADLKPLFTASGMPPPFYNPAFFVVVVIHVGSPLPISQARGIIGTHPGCFTTPGKFIVIAWPTPRTGNQHHCSVLFDPISGLPTHHPQQQDVPYQTGLDPDPVLAHGTGLSQSNVRASSRQPALS